MTSAHSGSSINGNRTYSHPTRQCCARKRGLLSCTLDTSWTGTSRTDCTVLYAPQNHLDGFYSSPLRRAQETAHIIDAKIGQNAELRIGVQEVRLIELPALVILEILSIIDPVDDYRDARAGGRIRWPFEGRVSAVLLDIVARHPNQRVAVIAHAGVISAALSWYLPEKRWRWWRTTVSNCSLTGFRVEGNRAELLAVNDIRHLGFFVIPFKRKQAKDRFKEKMISLRTKLLSALTTQFSNESENAIDRLKEGVAPYTRYVRSECERIDKAASTLARLRQNISELRARRHTVVEK